MQGRLSSPVGGRIQAFPVESWRDEFPGAAEAGLDCIEWVYEEETELDNPLRTEQGVYEIRALAAKHGIGVWSVCADFYMTRRLVGKDGKPEIHAVEHLVNLMSRVTLLGARYIVLPFVDESSIRNEELKALEEVLRHFIPVTERTGIELHLETDLEPAEFRGLLKRIAHPKIRANYDIGNSASLGRDPTEELPLIGPWLGSVHVKDRERGDGTVSLGTGAADFSTCFRLIMETGFQGPFILQTARIDCISEVELARKNRDFVLKHIAAVVR